jgi:DNA-binding YbaB/EbfC family protein
MMDIAKMMQQAKVMQTKMQEMQEKMADVEVQGESGGGLVKVTITCKGETRTIEIDDSLIIQSEKETLEDMVKAALNNAKSKADKKLAEETQKMMQELGIPPGAKLPF